MPPPLERLARHHPAPPAARSGWPPPSWSSPASWAFRAGPRSPPRVEAERRLPPGALGVPVRLGRRTGCGRPPRSCAPIRVSPSAVCAPRPCSATPRRCASTSPPTRGRALALDDERGWPPLLYACYSRWHQVDPAGRPGWPRWCACCSRPGPTRTPTTADSAHYRSALKGSVEVNNPDVTEVLLDAGAHPDPGQPIAEAAAHRDLRCLRLLLAHGARVASTWAVGAAVFNDNPGAAALLLDALATAGGRAARRGQRGAARRRRQRVSRPWSRPSWTPERIRERRTRTGSPRCAWRYGRAGRRPRHGCGRSAPSRTAPRSTGFSARA